jgi:hypothetical protein
MDCTAEVNHINALLSEAACFDQEPPESNSEAVSELQFSNIPAALRERKQWVVWRYEARDSDGKQTKVPYRADGKGKAKANDPATWGTFDLALRTYRRGGFSGIGFEFSHDDPFIGIDLDACRNPQTGQLAEWAERIVKQLDTYSEVSPGGFGIKLYALARAERGRQWDIEAEPPEGCDKQPAVEIYPHGRYFAVTGWRLPEFPADPQSRQEAVDALLASGVAEAPHKLNGKAPHVHGGATANVACDDLALARSALWAINPSRADTYHAWIQVGMACRAVGEELFADFERWSAQSNKFRNGECRAKWESFNGDGVGAGTLFHLAKQDGWDRPRQKSAGKKATARNDDVDEEKLTQAEQLVRLAQESYRFGRTDKDEPFAVAHTGANVAIMLKGSGDALRAKLAKDFRRATGKTAGASALADAMNVLHGEALDADAEPVHLRLAMQHGETVVIDLADAAGRAVTINASDWQVVDRSPVLFRRTALTSVLPIPERGGALSDLRKLLNVSDQSWPLIVGWLVAALLPEIPHPILLLSGTQGSGKSCAARVLVGLVDPSPAPLRGEPHDLEQWQVAASGSWIVVIDNLSKIHGWFSDALCKAATGDGLVKRKLYSDGDLAVLAFRRVVALTSIDAGAIRGDLGERLLLVDLDAIREGERQTEQELDLEFAKRRPAILGALLDALAAVLAKLPTVRPKNLPRMADFGRVLAAADATGITTGALARFLDQQGRIAADVLDSDSFGLALVEFLRDRQEWQGTASELIEVLCSAGQHNTPLRDWPHRNAVRGRLKRLTPTLKAHGMIVETGERETTPRRRRLIRLAVGKCGENIVQNVQSVQKPPEVDNLDNAPGTFSNSGAGESEPDAWGEV